MSSYAKDILRGACDTQDILSIRQVRDGMKEGVKMYAHYKDGIQYVGTTGRTLKEAIKEIEDAAEELTQAIRTKIS